MSGFIQSTTTQSAAANNVTCTLAGVTAGNQLVLLVIADAASNVAITSAISGDVGNSWAQGANKTVSSVGYSAIATVWYCLSSGSGSRNPTVTCTNAGTTIAHLSEWNGITAADVNGAGNTSTSGTPALSGNVLPSQANSVVFALMGELGSTTTDNPANPATGTGTTFTAFSPNAALQNNGSAFSGFEGCYSIMTSAATVSASWAYSGGNTDWTATIMSFKYSPGGVIITPIMGQASL